MIQRLLLPLAVLAFSLPAFAQVSLPTFTAKPPRIRHQMANKKIDYRVQIAPGVANPGEATTIRLSISNVLHSHDARFGTRQPINDAKLTAYLVAPRSKAHRAWSATRTFLNVRDAGTYTVVFTSPVEGVHNLIIKGTSESAGPIEYSFPVSFGTWPIEKDVELPGLPRRLPKAELSDMDYGKALCEKHCLKNLAFALPKGATPTFLDSSVVAAMANTDLLTNLIGETKIRSLTQTDQYHLLYYVHTLHNGIRDFFPKANRYLAQEFTINEYGLDRLDETARLQLSDKEATAMVLVAFKGGEATAHPELIPYEDRTARDALQVSDKIGYVVFLSGKDGKLYELGFGLNLEPTYSISQIIARSQDGTTDTLTGKTLRSFRGLGRFNDARSLRRGSKTLQSQLLPLYLIAAELGTMYYADEREFTAFDSEFADLD